MVLNRLDRYLKTLEEHRRILHNAGSSAPRMQMSEIPWPTVTNPKNLRDITRDNVKLFCEGVRMFKGVEWPGLLAEMKSDFKGAARYQNVQVSRERGEMRDTVDDIHQWLDQVDASVSWAGFKAPAPPPIEHDKPSRVRPIDLQMDNLRSLMLTCEASKV
jgi:hypothetical protein